MNIDKIVSGSLASPFARGNCILMEDGKITAIGTLLADMVSACDMVVDAGGRHIVLPWPRFRNATSHDRHRPRHPCR